MKKLITTAAAVLISAVMLCGCAGQSEQDNTESIANEPVQISLPEERDISEYEPVLMIDGVEVPFLQGEDEVQAQLGKNFSEWVDFTFPEGVTPSDPVLVMPFKTVEEDICEITTYTLNYTDGNPQAHELRLFGIKGLYIPIPDLNKKYKGKLMSLDESNFELIYVNGAYLETPKEENNITQELDRMLLIDRTIDSYMVIDLLRSPENTADLITFTVVCRTQEFDQAEEQGASPETEENLGEA